MTAGRTLEPLTVEETASGRRARGAQRHSGRGGRPLLGRLEIRAQFVEGRTQPVTVGPCIGKVGASIGKLILKLDDRFRGCQRVPVVEQLPYARGQGQLLP